MPDSVAHILPDTHHLGGISYSSGTHGLPQRPQTIQDSCVNTDNDGYIVEA